MQSYKKEKQIFLFVAANLIFVCLPFQASYSREQERAGIDETKDIVRKTISAIEALEKKLPISGRGTASMKTDKYFGGYDNKILTVDFSFKNQNSRWDTFEWIDIKKQKLLTCISTDKNYITYSLEEEGSVGIESPKEHDVTITYVDMHPITFLRYSNLPITKELQNILNNTFLEDPNHYASAILDDKGILNIIYSRPVKRPNGSSSVKTQMSFDTNKEFVPILYQRTFKFPEITINNKVQLEWTQYDSLWYISQAEYFAESAEYKQPDNIIYRIFNIQNFTPNVQIPDSEYTLKGLDIPLGTLVMDRLADITYSYGESENLLEDQEKPQENIINNRPEDVNLAKFILDRMLENRNKVKNYKFTFEKIKYNSEQSRRDDYEFLLKNGLEKEQAERFLNIVYSYEKDTLASDTNHCGRAEIIIEEMDVKGNRTGKITQKIINTWDGKNSIMYTEKPNNINAVIGGTEPSEYLDDSMAQPWRGSGGNFCYYLKKALDENRDVKAKRQEDGKYYIEFTSTSKRIHTGLIDPNQGYSVILEESYFTKDSGNTYNSKFREVKPGIWFPIREELIIGNSEEPYLKETMTVNEIIINDPNFYNGLYHVNFKEGTKVYDKFSGLSYVVVESETDKNTSYDEVVK